MKGRWKSARGVDLYSLKDRLSSDKRLVAAWFPDRGNCYMIVSKPEWKRNRNGKR